MLMANTLKSAERLFEKARNRKLKPLTLNILEKVPSDIEIAMAQTPKPITQMAVEIGIHQDELESYGRYKAKVELSLLDRLKHRKDGKYIVISGYVLFCCYATGSLSDVTSKYHSYSSRRGQVNYNYWPRASARSAPWSSGVRLRAAT